MSQKQSRIAGWTQPFEGQGFDPHYLAFFDCFNRRLFFEAHEVLESLWLRHRGDNYGFYKGLIQLAGAFVHVQKGRPQPANALLKLAEANFRAYPVVHDGLDLRAVRGLIEQWRRKLEGGEDGRGSWLQAGPPRLSLPQAKATRS